MCQISFHCLQAEANLNKPILKAVNYIQENKLHLRYKTQLMCKESITVYAFQAHQTLDLVPIPAGILLSRFRIVLSHIF
jgi:hypothetical protein